MKIGTKITNKTIPNKVQTTTKAKIEVNPYALGKAGNNAIQLMCTLATKSANIKWSENYLNLSKPESAQVYKELTKAIYKRDQEITEELKNGN